MEQNVKFSRYEKEKLVAFEIPKRYKKEKISVYLKTSSANVEIGMRNVATIFIQKKKKQ